MEPNFTWVHTGGSHGIGVGSRVALMFRGRLLTGQGNRITKRGSVLAEDARRDLGSNGRRHAHYYVPLDELRLAKPGSGPRHHSKRTPE